MTEGEIKARIEEIDDEIDQLKACQVMEYRMLEGFDEWEEGEDGEIRIYPVAEAEDIDLSGLGEVQ